MNLDDLQSVRSKERQTDSLQQLSESFYADAGAFVNDLREKRERAAAAADDPFDAPEVNRLSDDINTAEQTVEAIYERRVGKIVKKASLAAADMPTDDDGLTAEERDLFETLVEAIESNRSHVLDVLAGEATPGVDATPDDTAAPATDDDTATEANARPDPTAEAAAVADERGPPVEPSGGDPPGARADGDADRDSVAAADLMGGTGDDERASADAEPSPDGGTTTADATRATANDERETVRITADVGAIYGVDEREYELTTDDVVSLPQANAGPLVEQGAAERLE